MSITSFPRMLRSEADDGGEMGQGVQAIRGHTAAENLKTITKLPNQ